MPESTDQLFARLRKTAADAAGAYLTEHVNDSDAAVYLNDRTGYLVFNVPVLRRTVRAAAVRAVRRGVTRDVVEDELRKAARSAVGIHRAYVGGTAPPIRAGGPRRPRRLGRWADRRGVTADSHKVYVDRKLVSDLPGPRGRNFL